jgi:hypothetical protein
MAIWKVKPAYDWKRNIAYRREYYRCERDDVWGRLEIPIGSIQEYPPAKQQAVITPSGQEMDVASSAQTTVCQASATEAACQSEEKELGT